MVLLAVRRREMTMTTYTYRDIVEDLTARIRNGEYPPGSKLPTRETLATAYSVSVPTIKNAMRVLTDRGLIEDRPGRGLHVVEHLPE